MKTTIPSLIGALWLVQSLFAGSTIQFQTRVFTVAETAGQVALPVVRLNDWETEVAVEFYSVEATATAGQDFTAVSGTLSFAAGVTNQMITVPILNDALVESLDRFQVVLTNATGGAVLGSMRIATVSIQDNDTGPYFASATHEIAEDAGSALVQVNWVITDTDEPQTVDYATIDGTALAGTDYEAASGTLAFGPGERIQQIPVVILNDGVKDPDKSFQLQLSNASSVGLGNPSLTTVTIQDPTPLIYTQPTPASQSVSLGAVISIQVSAKGARMQWQKWVGESEFTDVPDANGQVLEWSSATVDLTGEYRFVVSNSTGETVISQIASVEVDPTFTKITEGPHVTDLGTSGFGSWGDYDNDGYQDLVVHRRPLGIRAIYRNGGDGTFSRLPEAAGLTSSLGYLNWCDWDNDGRQDLLAWDQTHTWVAYGDGAGGYTAGGWSVNGDWGWYGTADYDRDGLLDHYFGMQNRLHRNTGERSFGLLSAAEVGQVGLVNTFGSICWGDFDDDGWPDLFLPSLRESRSYIFRNEGTGRFTAVTNLVTQTGGPAFQGAWGDYDNDDRLDLCVVSFNGISTVYRNLGNGEFERPANVPTLSSGPHNFAAWIDYDNDGFLDLWVSGYTSGNKLFRNQGDGSFTQVTSGSIVNERPLNNAGTYQVAWFDYDNDGALDLYVMNGDDSSSIWTVNQLFHNNGNTNAWLTVKLIGTVSNRDAVGAKVRALATYAGEARWQRRDITGGEQSNGNHRHAHFGFGDAAQVDVLRIEWPSGIVQELQAVAPNQILTVTEPPRLVPHAAGKFQIHCWINQSFEVQCSSDLTTWAPMATVTNLTGTLVFEDVETDQHDCRYYRVTKARPNMVWIPPGTFLMGSPEDEVGHDSWEAPLTMVTLSQGFWMGKYEVTQEEYLDAMGNNPSWFNGDRTSEGGRDFGANLSRPVEQVSWGNAVRYCAALTTRARAQGRISTDYEFRLPTEAEWEYAGRAGTTTRFSYGDDPDYTNLTNHARYRDNSDGQTQPVGQKVSNPWGLYDMQGNTWEWCQDRYFSYPGGTTIDLQGPTTGNFYMIRGGDYSWADSLTVYRSAYRYGYNGTPDNNRIGFRVVLAPSL